MTFAATWLINIRLPLIGSGGLIHLGNVPMLAGAMLFGRKTGAISGAFGMALFDVMGGWLLWAPFTLVIVGLMGYTVGVIGEKTQSFQGYVLAMVVACIIKIIGYYGAEGIIYGNWLAPMASVPGNLVQIGVASAIVLPIVLKLRKHRAVLSLAASRR